MRRYDPEHDFLRVRDFLNETYVRYPFPCNWGLERWNYARYFVAPLLGASGTEPGTPEGCLEAIRLWEDMVRVWEGTDGEIIGVTCIEHPDPTNRQYGEVFVQRHPDHLDLLEEMIVFGEETYVNPIQNRVFTWAYDDDEVLVDVLERRGYVRRTEPFSHHLEYVIGDLPELDLPHGYRLQSMAEENDIEKRREVFGRGFNHDDPVEWPSAFAYRELQRAPDYHLENDFVIVAEDGTYAACCIVWLDAVNRIAHLEPLATHPEHRGKGLATQIQFAALRRARDLGAIRMPMTGGFEPFYRSIGFVPRSVEHPWIRQF